jgi:uncharacterized protein YsxB (DUF464 family)
MITVEIHKELSGRIQSLIVSDHSGYAEADSDIICAGASTLVYTAIGAIQEMCGIDDFYRIEEASDEDSIPFSVITLPDSDLSDEQINISQIIMQTVVIGFMQLEESVNDQYGNQFIRVTEITKDL